MRRKTPAPSRAEMTFGELAPGGEAVAVIEWEGQRRAVFARGCVPGDRAIVDFDASSRPARGRLVQLLSAGSSRVEPSCKHASRCGGCDWMHVGIEAQREAHVHHVQSALPSPGSVTVNLHSASNSLRFRTRARVHVRVSGGKATVGMNEARSHSPVEVESCIVLHERIDQARAALQSLFDGASGRGDVHLALGAPHATPRPVVADVRWSDALAPACYARFEAAVQSGLFAGIRVLCGDSRLPSTIGDPTPWVVGADGEALKLAPGGFSQASEEGNRILANRVMAAVDECGENLRTLELHSGAGNFTVLLARRFANVTAVESVGAACDAARANLASRGLKATVLERDANTFEWASGTQLVLLDPPRTGAREVVERLAQSRVKHVVYVSCDPSTLKRDLALLQSTYEVVRADAVDMFPQTSHIEAVIRLERRHPAKPSGAG